MNAEESRYKRRWQDKTESSDPCAANPTGRIEARYFQRLSEMSRDVSGRFPLKYIAPAGNGLQPEFRDYAAPLVGDVLGLPRLDLPRV